MKVVIADDEEIILKWMKKNIETLFPECQVVAACANGKQALECCREWLPDLLFTDIRMPVMDGMELVSQLKKEEKFPYTVILSAYDDFSYAREAMKLGVKDFLLKSEITKEELCACIQKAEKSLESTENWKKERQQEEIKSFFSEIVKGGSWNTPEQLLEWKNLWGEDEYTILMLKNKSKQFHLGRVEQIMEFFFQEKNKKAIFVAQNDTEALILVKVRENEISELTTEMLQTLSSFGNTEVVLCAGGIGSSGKDLEKVYKEVEKKAERLEFYGRTSVWSANEKQYEALFKEEETKWEEGHYEQALEHLGKIFEMFCREMPDIVLVRRFVLDLLLKIYWNYLDDIQRKKFSIDELILITHCKNIHMLEQKVLEYVRKFISELESVHPAYSEAVCKVMEYIDENYRENISLEEIANFVHMNKSYLSHLFKKETEKNIYSYLLDFRMEKAKKLLTETKQSIYQVGCLVGIPDSAYFSKVFKKHTGMTPLEFRRR